MLTLKQFFLSKTIWVLAGTLVLNLLQNYHPVVTPGTQNTLNEVLTVLAGVARTFNTQNAATPNKQN